MKISYFIYHLNSKLFDRFIENLGIIWRPPSLSELTPMISYVGLTHLGLEATIYCLTIELDYRIPIYFYLLYSYFSKIVIL